MKNGDESLEVAGVRVSSARKELFPDAGLAKTDLVDYYQRVARFILPHLEDRPLTLVRCPEGRRSTCFYQKHPGPGLPHPIHVVTLSEAEGTGDYMWVGDVAGLVGLVQIGALELHVWGARRDRPDRADRMVFDLDPGPRVSFAAVVAAARTLRKRLEDAGLESFPMLTGGAGLHVVVPLERRHGFDEVRAFSARVARRMAEESPGDYVAKAARKLREGRVFLDYLRNARGATAICPYSPRARPGAPVATPLRWDELGPGLAADAYDVRSVQRRLAHLRRDPWRGYGDLRQRLDPGALRKA